MGTRCAQALQPLGEGRDPGIVEAHAVDDGAILRQPKQARTRIAGLGTRRDRAGLDETETHPHQGAQRHRILVEAGRQADRIAEGQTGDIGREVGGSAVWLSAARPRRMARIASRCARSASNRRSNGKASAVSGAIGDHS